MVAKRLCMECGKLLTDIVKAIAASRGEDAKFCTKKCRKRFHSRNHWEKTKHEQAG